MDTLWLIGFNQLGSCFPRKLCGLGRGSLEILGLSCLTGYIICSGFMSVYEMHLDDSWDFSLPLSLLIVEI